MASSRETSLRPRVLVSWSTGKDSAWLLWVLRQQPEVDVVGLLTTFNGAADRVAMHAVRRTLAVRQAELLGLPLTAVELPWPCSNEIYERRMRAAIAQAAADGVTHIAFGDLFLEEIRDYRIRLLAGSGVAPLFPIWCGVDGTTQLAREMISSGLQAIVTCVDSRVLPREFAGRQFDAQFLDDLPPTVDPCGEQGEFHTFCWNSPLFPSPISIRPGQIEERDGFIYADLLRAIVPDAESSLLRKSSLGIPGQN